MMSFAEFAVLVIVWTSVCFSGGYLLAIAHSKESIQMTPTQGSNTGGK